MKAAVAREKASPASGSSEPLLSHFIGSKRQFARSVNLQQDIQHPEPLTTYYFGRKSIQLLEMLVAAFKPEIVDRAWFVAGPYGSGKSTFALFLACLLSGRQHESWLRPALERLRNLAPTLYKRLDREILDLKRCYVPVVVQGHRGDLPRALLSGLLGAARGQSGGGSWASRGLVAKLSRALAGPPGRRVEGRAVHEAFEHALTDAKKRRKAGLILLVDEFGKFLEAAPYQAGGVDLMPLQDLAELGTRSASPQLHLLLFLHQSFEHYAGSIPHHQRQEWAKIQGRFREVDFTEDADEVYDLVAAALAERRRPDESFLRRVGAWAKEVSRKALEFPAFQIGAREDYWIDLFDKTYPLHPMALFALPRLSARVAQNERTVFTFLASEEPLGLRGFLSATTWRPDRPPTVTLDYLYDYFLQAFRGDVSLGSVGRRWIEVASALDRLGDRPELEQRIIKVTGILNLLSLSRLAPATKDMLRFALNVPTEEEDKFEEALRYLVERKILVFRRHTNEFRVWQGSDFEFDQAVEALRSELRKGFDIGTYLQTELPPPTLVARRHSHRVGALRFFAGEYATLPRLRELDLSGWKGAELDRTPPDGRVVYVLPETSTEAEEACAIAKRLLRPSVILVVPKIPVPYLQTALELVALHRLEASATELRDDPVAQRELNERIATCEESLRRLVAQVTEPVRASARWFTARGRKHDIDTSEQAQRLISKICDKTFHLSPTVRNEMVNRTELSSNISMARNRLVAKMMEDTGKPNLGINGNPPELAILRALLVNHGVYRERAEGVWKLGAPSTRDEGYRACWKAIEIHVFGSKVCPRPVVEIFDALAQAPYGARRGITQILFFAVLLHHRDCLALYEEGIFVRDWTPDRIEMLFKRPDRFSVRYLDIAGSRRWLVDAIRRRVSVIAKHVQGAGKEDGDRFGETLKSLYRWLHSLPNYARSTFKLSDLAQKLRQALLTAKAPEKLFFEDLPAIFGIRPDSLPAGDTRGTREDEENGTRLVTQLESALSEIDGAYERLLERIQQAIISRLELPKDVARARIELADLKSELCPILSDAKAKVFLTRASDKEQALREWTESIAAGLEGKPPAFWIDAQEEDFSNAVARIAQQVRDARSLGTALARTGPQSNWERYQRVLVDSAGQTVLEEVLPRGELSKEGQRVLERLARLLSDEAALEPQECRQVALELFRKLTGRR